VSPAVSVVIVSFRSRESLAPCLASLRACLTAVPLEVVVVDNASDDGTVAWLAEAHPWVEVIANRDNRGFGAAVNQGAARARAPRLLVLNPDCEVSPGALTRLLAALHASPDRAVAAPALVDEHRREARSCGRFPTLWSLVCDHLGLASAFPRTHLFGGYKYGGVPLAALDRVDWASGAALLVRRAAWDAVGGFDERIFLYMEEVDWCRRAAALGWTVRYVPEARVRHDGGRSSRTAPGASYLHNLRSRVYYARKHLGGPAALATQLLLTLSLVLKWMVMVARGPARARVYADGVGAVWAA
jgi:N-acetylglucosaminyl-diphospho-decaprenol L-rhamnosyltransferase